MLHTPRAVEIPALFALRQDDTLVIAPGRKFGTLFGEHSVEVLRLLKVSGLVRLNQPYKVNPTRHMPNANCALAGRPTRQWQEGKPAH